MNRCKDCHFLAKIHVTDGGQEISGIWSPEERNEEFIKDHYSAECREGVWNNLEGSKLRAEINKDRGNSCFFFKYVPGMNFPAARKLQARMLEEEKNGSLNSRLDSIDDNLKGLDSRMKSLESLKNPVKRIEKDFGLLRGDYAERKAREAIHIIAEEATKKQGCSMSWGDIMTRSGIIDIAKAGTGFDKNSIESLMRADIVYVAPGYSLVVEVSFCVDNSDVERAVRHSEIIEKIQRKKCFPAVAGVRKDNTTDLSGVYYHQINFDDEKL